MKALRRSREQTGNVCTNLFSFGRGSKVGLLSSKGVNESRQTGSTGSVPRSVRLFLSRPSGSQQSAGCKQERPSRTSQRGHCVRRSTVHRTVDEGQRSKTCQRRAGPRSSSDSVIGSLHLAQVWERGIEPLSHIETPLIGFSSSPDLRTAKI